MSSSLLRVCVCAVLLLQLAVWASASAAPVLRAGYTYGFETPAVRHESGGYEFSESFPNPAGHQGGDSYIPFAMSLNSGIAKAGSYYDPPAGGAAAGQQYGFLSSSGSMKTAVIAANVTNLEEGEFVLEFAYAVCLAHDITVRNLELVAALGKTVIATIQLHNTSDAANGWTSVSKYFSYRKSKGHELTFTLSSPGPTQVLLLDEINVSTGG